MWKLEINKRNDFVFSFYALHISFKKLNAKTMLEHILPCGQTSVSCLAFPFQINHTFPERNYIRILQIPKINKFSRIRKIKKYLSKVVAVERIRVKIKQTSKNAGLNINRTKIQLKIMAIIDFALVQ